jgi:hypothetical protein
VAGLLGGDENGLALLRSRVFRPGEDGLLVGIDARDEVRKEPARADPAGRELQLPDHAGLLLAEDDLEGFRDRLGKIALHGGDAALGGEGEEDPGGAQPLGRPPAEEVLVGRPQRVLEETGRKLEVLVDTAAVPVEEETLVAAEGRQADLGGEEGLRQAAMQPADETLGALLLPAGSQLDPAEGEEQVEALVLLREDRLEGLLPLGELAGRAGVHAVVPLVESGRVRASTDRMHPEAHAQECAGHGLPDAAVRPRQNGYIHGKRENDRLVGGTGQQGKVRALLAARRHFR